MVDFYRQDALPGQNPFRGFAALALEKQLERQTRTALGPIDVDSAAHWVGVAHPSDAAAFSELPSLTLPYTFDGPGVDRRNGALVHPPGALASARDAMVRREHLMTKDAQGRPTAVITASLPHLLPIPPEHHRLLPESAAEVQAIFEGGRFIYLGGLAVHPQVLRAGLANTLLDYAKQLYKGPLVLHVLMAREDEMGATRPESLNEKAIALFQKAGFHFGGWTSTFTDVPGFSPEHPDVNVKPINERLLGGLFYMPSDRRSAPVISATELMRRVYDAPWSDADRSRRYDRSDRWYPAGRSGDVHRPSPSHARTREQTYLNLARGSFWVSRRPQSDPFAVDDYEGVK